MATATEIGADETADDRSLILVCAGVVLTAITALFAVREGADDAYIVFRYVVRWLNGEGLTFNDGEAVEGFTSVSWVMVLGFFTRLTGMPVASVSILLNYVLLLATAVLLERTLRKAGAGVTVRAIALGVFGTSFPYFQMTFLGLELALFGLVLTMFGALLCSAVGGQLSERQRANTWLALGLFGGFLAATRPETIVLFPLVVVALHVLGPRPSGRALFASVLVYAGATGAVLLWRQLQYGEWLPNSVIAKSIAFDDPRLSNVIEQRVREGVTYLRQAYTTYPVFAGITGVALVLVVTRTLSRRSVLLLLPLVLAHAIAVENGGDWMPHFRLLTMYWPVWLLAAWSMSSDLYRRYGRVAFGALVAVVALHGWSTVRAMINTEDIPVRVAFEDRWPDLKVTDDSSMNGFSFTYEAVGHALRKVWQRNDVLASESVGRLGYVAPELSIHDPMGLTDRNLARDSGAYENVYGRTNWRYTMSLEPSIVLLHYWPHQREWSSFGEGYPERFDRYCMRPPFREADPFTLYVIVRKDRRHYSKALQAVGVQPLESGDGKVRCPGGPWVS